jgi:hypothetical protein
LGRPGCDPPSQVVDISSGGPAPLFGTPLPGTATRAVLALFLRPSVGVEQKMILRMNGTGALKVDARRPDGTLIGPTHVDAGHAGSSYDAWFPGTTEWGVFFTFPTAGCWQVHAESADTGADFYFFVAPS